MYPPHKLLNTMFLPTTKILLGGAQVLTLTHVTTQQMNTPLLADSLRSCVSEVCSGLSNFSLFYLLVIYS